MKRKILANILTLCMLFSMIPMTAFAAVADGTLTVKTAALDTPEAGKVTLTIEGKSNTDTGDLYYQVAEDDSDQFTVNDTFANTSNKWTAYTLEDGAASVELSDVTNGYVVMAVYVEDVDGTDTVKAVGTSEAISDGTTTTTPLTGVTIAGDAKVGSTLTATVQPENATADYQWKATSDGATADISGATGNSYQLTESELGKTITVVATGTGSYSGKVTSAATAAVVAADPAPSDKTQVTLEATMADKAYDGDPVVAPTVTAKAGATSVTDIEADGYTFTWYASDDADNALDAAPTDAGSYKLVISLKDNDKYTADDLALEFSITKAAAKTLTGTAVLSTTQNQTTTVDLTAILAAAGIEDEAATYTIGDVSELKLAATESEGTLTLTTGEGATDGATENVTVTVTLTNYADSTITITVTYTSKAILTIANEITGLTYTGVKAVISEPTVTGTVTGKTPTITTTYKDAEGTVVEADDLINAGDYTVTYAVTADETYAAVEETIPFTIAKADLTVSGDVTPITVDEGDTLADATISGLTVKGVGTPAATIEGTWTWVEPATTELTQTGTHNAKFVPTSDTDKANYNELTKEGITITVAPALITMKTVTTDIVGVTATIVQPVAADPENDVAAQDGKIVLTGKMKKAADTYHISYTTNKSETAVTVGVTLSFDGDNAVWTMADIELTGGTYKLDARAVEFLPENVDLKPVAPTVDVTDQEISDKLDAIDYDVTEAVTANASDILTNEVVNDLIPEDAAAVTALLGADGANVDVTSGAENYTEVHVVSYFDIDVTGYEAADTTDPENPVVASLKLDITPMVKRMAANVTNPANPVYADFKNATDTKATKVENYEASEPIVFTVKLPTGFVNSTGDNVAVTKHYNADNTVKEWLRTVVAGANQTFTASFNASTFSEYEIVADARTVTVTFDANGGTLVGDSPVTYTPAMIGTEFPTATTEDTEKEFKGWAASADATSAAYVDSLTDAYLTALNGAKDNEGKVVLYAVFGAKGGTTDPGNTGSSGSSGGSSGGVSSNVTVSSATNGKVTVTPTAPSKGATVTINLTPDSGYQVGSVTVTDKDGNAVELTKVSDTQYTFTMPDGKVTVRATFTQVEAPSSTGFTDVAAGAYYADAVKWAVEQGITNGLTSTTFGPDNSCTRGQMVTFLWRAAGSPAATGTNSFSDVASGEYYYDAVLWAVEKGITNGTSDTTFSPNATVTRGQTVTFLYRYAGSPAVSGDNSFTDVASGEFYANAVTWAVAEEITNGTSTTTFSPASNCTRGQIVTFLYRQIAQ